MVAVGIGLGVAVGYCCARQSEEAAREESNSEKQGDKYRRGRDKDAGRRPQAEAKSEPLSPLLLCLFFGTWGGIIGGMAASGGNGSVAAGAGILCGLLWLMIERTSVGYMAAQG